MGLVMDGISVLKKEVKKACSSTSATLKHIQKVPYVRKGAQHMAIHELCLCDQFTKENTLEWKFVNKRCAHLELQSLGSSQSRSQESLSVKASLEKEHSRCASDDRRVQTSPTGLFKITTLILL